MKVRTDKCLQCPDQGGLPSMKGYTKGRGLCEYHHMIALGHSRSDANKSYPDHPCAVYDSPRSGGAA